MSDRKFVRFKPDTDAIALIDLNEDSTEFNPTITALVLNESYSGCALIFAHNDFLKPATKVKIKIGKLDPLKGQVAWSKILEENIQKVGIALLE